MVNPLSSTSYNDHSDDLLIKEALKGQSKPLNELLSKHQDYIFNVALKMLNSIADAEDATQEILIKVVTNLSKYKPEKARFRTWMYRITVNHILNVKKSGPEKHELTFPKFFEFIGNVPDEPLLEGSTVNGLPIEEARISCMAGMLMCLDRNQRLTYIIGEIFKIDHNLASEIFEITPDNFRKKLSRARADLHQWMHEKCGLVNNSNPCRCRNKTKKFIEQGIVNPVNPKWQSNFKKKIFELVEEKADEMALTTDELCTRYYRLDPFKTNLKAKEVYQEIIGNKKFARFMNL